jgi:hypothetical protein
MMAAYFLGRGGVDQTITREVTPAAVAWSSSAAANSTRDGGLAFSIAGCNQTTANANTTGSSPAATELHDVAVGGRTFTTQYATGIPSGTAVTAAGTWGAVASSGVALVVYKDQAADLEASDNTLEFETTVGANPPAQTVEITNVGDAGGTLTFAVSDDAAWLSVNGGDLTAPETLTISVDTSGLIAGVYSGQVTVNPDDAGDVNEIIDVTLTVSASRGGRLLTGVG